MTGDEASLVIRVELRETSDIDELIIAFRQDDELEELASVSPPAVAELKKSGDRAGLDDSI